MKKLNKKGFTLIELLAVIVILAVVMVVTIPSVLSSISTAREKSLQNAANTVAEWCTKQNELKTLGTGIAGTGTISSNFSALTIPTSKPSTDNLTDAILKEAGLGGGTADATGKVWKSGNKLCVELTAVSTGTFASTTVKTSSGC